MTQISVGNDARPFAIYMTDMYPEMDGYGQKRRALLRYTYRSGRRMGATRAEMREVFSDAWQRLRDVDEMTARLAQNAEAPAPKGGQ